MLLLGGLTAAAAFVATWWPLFAPRPGHASALVRGLTVMTLNVLADNPQHGALAAAVAVEDPDVVAFQELEPDAAADLVRSLAECYPYHALVREVKRGAGVLSKYPLRDAEPVRLSDDGNWNQRLVVETPLGQLTLLNVHPAVPSLRAEGLGPFGLPIVYDTARRSTEVARLLELVDGAAGPVLVTGDFNLSDIAGTTGCAGRLGDAYRSAGWGFGHTFPRVGSFPQSLPAPWPVVRLDYVWHSPELRPVAAHVGPSGGSDHHAVVVRLVQADGVAPSGRGGRGEASPKCRGDSTGMPPMAVVTARMMSELSTIRRSVYGCAPVSGRGLVIGRPGRPITRPFTVSAYRVSVSTGIWPPLSRLGGPAPPG